MHSDEDTQEKTRLAAEFIKEIMPKVKLVPEAQPSGINVPSGIIPISQYIISTVGARGKAECPLQHLSLLF